MTARPIKFRAWDKDKREIFVPSRLIYPYEDALLPKTFKENTQLGSAQVVLMQFTGLTDKNGKEIYEGDIVRAGKLHDNDNPKVGEVVFVRGCFYVGDRTLDKCLIGAGIATTEVIGNRFENKDLLE